LRESGDRVSSREARPIDVLILGGGPAGAACAIALAKAGREVIVLERSAYDSERVGEALSPAVWQPLSELGVWERFLTDAPEPSPGITGCWGGAEPFHNDFIANPLGPGWHVDRRRFDAMLAEAAEASRAEVLRGARLTRVTREGVDRWHIESSVGESRITRCARAVVDATGQSAALARRLGTRRVVHDRLIGLWAISAGATDRHSADRRTLIEAVDSGWWYSARLPDGRLSAALMTDSDLLPSGAAARRGFRRECLERAPYTMSRIGWIGRDEPFRIVSACSSRLENVAGPGWLAVGDAAMSFDPLSGRGVAWALESGLAAARALDSFLHGDSSATQDYERRADVDFTSYVVERDANYARERRWADSPFWRRRQARHRTGNTAFVEFS
jgi:flavin-dependent dehydrogenase